MREGGALYGREGAVQAGRGNKEQGKRRWLGRGAERQGRGASGRHLRTEDERGTHRPEEASKRAASQTALHQVWGWHMGTL